MLSMLPEARNEGQYYYQNAVSHNTTPRAPRDCISANRQPAGDSVLVLGSPGMGNTVGSQIMSRPELYRQQRSWH
ncbi:hypothetical protein M440DRAFT_1397060 [Trichoderma longibrachiatum ATCC 18648]|uniref:Uncharacterized protein n=1 Tax=Trichoderma longibrachiatum ATCC 18648 TaxID=983965 RepID=A0A2T4CJY8_TRILO|nr:hypothetical protein M440DRAFT_1397060 [Trichoderma longibrachiatum ATCC 18648]